MEHKRRQLEASQASTIAERRSHPAYETNRQKINMLARHCSFKLGMRFGKSGTFGRGFVLEMVRLSPPLVEGVGSIPNRRLSQ